MSAPSLGGIFRITGVFWVLYIAIFQTIWLIFCMVTGDNSSEVSPYSAVFSWNGDTILDAGHIP